VDFRKAFDSVSRESIPKILASYNVPEKLIGAVYSLYKDTTASVLTSDGPTEVFKTSSGVLQGDTLAPFLFILALDWVLRTAMPDDSRGLLLQRRQSSRYPEKRLSVLAYADDLVILASDHLSAQILLTILATVAAKVGLQINTDKTEVFSIPATTSKKINCKNHQNHDMELKNCSSFKYLGGWIPDGKEDLSQRRALAWSAVSRLRPIWNSKTLSDVLRSALFKATVETVLLYNAETWTTTDTFLEKLDAIHSGLLRAVFDIHWPTRISNADLYQRANLNSASSVIRKRRLALAGHIIRAEDYCPQAIHHVLLWHPNGPLRHGQGRRSSYINQILVDAGIGDTHPSKSFPQLRVLALSRRV
jgi:hypothetical protein